MRYMMLRDAKPGMRLAYDIYDSFGRTLVSSSVELTESYIEKLYGYGFDGVYITDELSEDIEIEQVIPPRLRMEGLVAVREGDVDACKEVAVRIVEEILSKKKLSLDLTDLRIQDDYLYAHSVNVAVVSCVIGIGMEMSATDLTHLVTAALLHDFGKLQIPSEILNKPGRLTQEEYAVMKSHSTLSHEMISNRWDLSAHVKNAVLFHHENVDGSGYPQGLYGDEQSIYTKVLHVADVYDALVSKRPYKNPYSPQEASEYMMGGCGIMFEKNVVETLLRYVPLYPKGTEIMLSDGRIGIIYDNTGIHNLRPIVRLLDATLMDLTDDENLGITFKSVGSVEETTTEKLEQERKEMIRPLDQHKILIVDDMKTNLQMLRQILEHSYELVLVKSGKQALLYLEKNEYPDLILMDIDMPEMNGIEATKRIQEMTQGKIPVIFVSALCDKDTVLACRELNAAGYIVRPYKPVYIKSEIKRILTGRSEIE